MKGSLFLYALSAFLLFFGNLAAFESSGQELVSAANFQGRGNREKEPEVSLSEILKAFENRYKVRFNYNSELVSGKRVSGDEYSRIYQRRCKKAPNNKAYLKYKPNIANEEPGYPSQHFGL